MNSSENETRDETPRPLVAVAAPVAALAPTGSSRDDKQKRLRPDKSGKGIARTIVEWVVLIVIALGVAFLVKSFLLQAFYIPSESMVPTLQVGDRILVNKLSYDLHEANRGDIVVFLAPKVARTSEIQDLVKRVIGLPGETITASPEGGVLVDGRAIKEPYIPKGAKTIFNGVPSGCGQPASGGNGCVVPEGRVFMMGDNRQASKDSRVFGPVKQSSFVGRAFLRIWPLSEFGFL